MEVMACSFCNGEIGAEPYDTLPLRLIDVQATLQCSRRVGSAGIRFCRSRCWHFHVISHTWSQGIRDMSISIGKKLPHAAAAAGPANSNPPPVNRPPIAVTYESFFSNKVDFGNLKSYQDLIEFLHLLSTEGVQWIWFDALCINQTDDKEKEVEIQNMGTYYQKSLGCYVVQHGIGMGYALLCEDPISKTASLPRWFSRVWTLQEWVLPREVNFVVGDLSKSVKLAANSLIRRYIDRVRHDPQTLARRLENRINHMLNPKLPVMLTSLRHVTQVSVSPAIGSQTSAAPAHRCHCCVIGCYHEDANFFSCIGNARVDVAQDELENAELICVMESGDCICPQEYQHIRQIAGRSNMYIMDGLGYRFLVGVQFWLWKIHNSTQSTSLHLLTLPLNLRGSNSAIAPGSGVLQMSRIIHEISLRDCSHEEDRVLSALKLIEGTETMQVRVQQTLDWQIDRLARCSSKWKLIQLCLVDWWGSEKAGRSWAPQFHKDDKGRRLRELLSLHSAESFFLLFQPEAKQINFVEDGTGCLKVETFSCWGKLVIKQQYMRRSSTKQASIAITKGAGSAASSSSAKAHLHEKHRQYDHTTLLVDLVVAGQTVICLHEADFKHTLVQDACILQPPAETDSGEGAVVLTAPGIHHQNNGRVFKPTIDVCLVFMGTKLRECSTKSSHELTTYENSPGIMDCFLVCIGETKGGYLHKIGYLSMPGFLQKYDPVQHPYNEGMRRFRSTYDDFVHTTTTCNIGGFGRDLSPFVLATTISKSTSRPTVSKLANCFQGCFQG